LQHEQRIVWAGTYLNIEISLLIVACDYDITEAYDERETKEVLREKPK
jgi:hypothetical protein